MGTHTEMSSEETERRLKNAQYQLVFPLRLRRHSKTLLENNDGETPSNNNHRKSNLKGGQ